MDHTHRDHHLSQPPKIPTLGELGSLCRMLLDCSHATTSTTTEVSEDMGAGVGKFGGERPLVLGPTLRPLANALWRRNKGAMCGCSHALVGGGGSTNNNPSSSPLFTSTVVTNVAISRIQRGMRMYEVDLSRKGLVSSSSSSSPTALLLSTAPSSKSIDTVINTPLEEFVCGYRPLGLRDLLPPPPSSPNHRHHHRPPLLLFDDTDRIGHPSVVPDANTLLLLATNTPNINNSRAARSIFRASLVREMIVRGVSASTDASTLTDDDRVRAVLSTDLAPSRRVRYCCSKDGGGAVAAVDMYQVEDGEVRCVVGSIRPHVLLQRVAIRRYDAGGMYNKAPAPPPPTYTQQAVDNSPFPTWLTEQVLRLGMRGIVELVTGVAVMDTNNNHSTTSHRTRWNPIPTVLRLWNCGGSECDDSRDGMGSRVRSSFNTDDTTTSFLEVTTSRAGDRKRAYPCDWLPLPSVGVVLTTALAYAIVKSSARRIAPSCSGGSGIIRSSSHLTIGDTHCSPRLLESLAISHHHNYRLTSLTLDGVGMDIQLVHLCSYLRGEVLYWSGGSDPYKQVGLTTLKIRNMPHCFSTFMEVSSSSLLSEFGALIGTLMLRGGNVMPFTLEIAASGLHDNHVRELYESVLLVCIEHHQKSDEIHATNAPTAQRQLSLSLPHNSISSIRRCFIDPITKANEEMVVGVSSRILSSLNLAGNILTSTTSHDLIDLAACVMTEKEAGPQHHQTLHTDQISIIEEVDDRVVRDAIYGHHATSGGVSLPSLNLNHSLTASSSPMPALVSWMKLAKKKKGVSGNGLSSWGSALLDTTHNDAILPPTEFTLPFVDRGSFAALHLGILGCGDGSDTTTSKQLRQLLPTCGLVTTYPWVVDAQSVKTIKRELRRFATDMTSKLTTTNLSSEATSRVGSMVVGEGTPPESWEDACDEEGVDDISLSHHSTIPPPITTEQPPPTSPSSTTLVRNPLRSLASSPMYPTSLCLSGWDFSASLSVSQVLLPVLPGLVTLDLSRTSAGAVEQLAAVIVRCCTVLNEVACEIDALFKLPPVPLPSSNDDDHAKLPLRHLVLDGCGLCSNESTSSLRQLLKSIGSSICPHLQSLSLKYNNSEEGDNDPLPKASSLLKSGSQSSQSHNHPSTKTRPHSQKSSMTSSTQPTTLSSTTAHHERITASLAHDDHNVPASSKADLLAFLKADARAKKRATNNTDNGQPQYYIDPTAPSSSSSVVVDGDMATTPFSKSLCSFLSRMVSPATFVRLDLSGSSQGVPNIRCALQIQQSLDERKVGYSVESEVRVCESLLPPPPCRAAIHLRHIDPVWGKLLPHHPLFTLPLEEEGGRSSSVDGRRYVCSIF